ncbi:MAG: transcriptional repressor [Clostridia bacterium]|nr:transcriptional repressor [Clostridia bacterium]MBR2926913.1 transcriptional repressor [Clostridia bacterium]
MTKQRELILSILKQSDRHLTADEIFFLAKLKMPSIAMATIYNNLNALDEAGVIHRLHIDGVADCFDKLTEPHDHLLCTHCGRIRDVRLPSVRPAIEGDIGTPFSEYELVVHYTCPECARK